MRLSVFVALLLFTAAVARAQTPPGAPNSPERFAYCEGARATCLQGTAQCSSAPEPPVCTEDVETACSKNFETCLAAGTETAPPPAGPAPVSCNRVFSRLRSYLRDPARWIASVWTTNYFANGARYAGRTGIAVKRQGRDLFGQSQRTRVFYGGAGAEVENVSFRIRADGKVMLSEIYGPYEPVCSADRFMVLYTGDSIEAFHFKN